MRTKSRTRSRGVVLAVLSLAVFLPELAQAQQTGLFPLAPAYHRQRVPCDQEHPAYKTIKEKYFGHHPTAWRKFPEGWGLKSKETPDVEKSFKELPLQTGDEPAQEERDTEEGMRPQPGPRQGVPPLPGGGRSPFDLDSPDTGGVRPGGQPGQPGQQRPALPPAGDPFELDKPDTPKANAPGGGQNRPTPPGASIGPGLSAPAERTGQYRSNRRPANDEPEPQEDDGPLLALPNINLPPIDHPAFASATQPTPTTAMAATTATATDESPATSAEAPPAPRRGFLSGLLNNLGWIRR
jgi:hypothetical protein